MIKIKLPIQLPELHSLLKASNKQIIDLEVAKKINYDIVLGEPAELNDYRKQNEMPALSIKQLKIIPSAITLTAIRIQAHGIRAVYVAALLYPSVKVWESGECAPYIELEATEHALYSSLVLHKEAR